MTRVSGKFSHRGVSMAILGGVWVIIGIGLFIDRDPTKFPVDLLPVPIPAFIWLLSGLAGVVIAVIGVGHHAADFVFGALTLPAVLRAGGFAYDWTLHLVGNGGEPDAWLGMLSWLLITSLIIHEATTPLIPRSLLRGPK